MAQETTRTINLNPAQMEFVSSSNPYVLFCGGLGSGKTHGGAVWAMFMALKYPGVKGIITANSYSQLKKATLSKFFEILRENHIPFTYKTNESVIEIDHGAGTTEVYAISAEKYDLARGIEVGWIWSDECAFYRKEAFDVFIGRIRDPKGPSQWKGTTTPNGFNWLYESFVESPLENSHIITGRTKDNLGNLSSNYYKVLSTQYSSKLAQQELEGEFVNLTSGKVYYSFDRRKHVQSVDIDDRWIWLGLDFNVHPLCGLFAYHRGDKIYVTEELYQKDSNTFKASKEILARHPNKQITVVADESGSKRKTSANETDYEILRRANLHVVQFRNPRVKDRYNNLNRLLEAGQIIIDPKCKKLIEDLEKLVYDNSNDMLSHSSDALGYLAWHLMPMKKPARAGKITYR